MSEILSNTGVKLWAETDYSELWLTVFDQLTGQGGKSNIRLIDEAIGKINATLDGYKFEFSSDEDRLYISKGDSKLPVSLIDSNGHVASKVDGTTITIDESGVVKGIPVDDALSEESTNPLQNKVIAGELKSIKSKMGTDESTIQNNTKRIEANETAISTLNGTGNGSVKKAVSDGIAKVVAGAPEDFDTLKEMSDWINSHESSASAMNSQIQDNKKAIDNHTLNGDIHVTMENKTNWNKVSEKLDKTGDASNVITEFTTATTRSNLTTKEKLSISLGKISKWFSDLKTVAFSGSYNDLSNKPASLPANGGNSTTVNGHTVNSDVPANAKFTDTTYEIATTTKTGIVKPDGTTITIDEDGTLHGVAEATVDDALSSTSTNPVQNKVVKDALDHKLKGYRIIYTIPANTGGWHKIAQTTSDYFNFDLYTNGGWRNQSKSNAHFQIQNTNGNARIVQLSGLELDGITKLRIIRVDDEKDIWILEEYSPSSVNSEIFKFTITGDVTVTPLDGSVDTTTDFKDSVSLDVSDIPTGTVITTGNIDSHLTNLKYGEVAGGKNLANVDNISNVFKFKVSGNRTYIVSANGANTYRVLGYKNGKHIMNIALNTNLINGSIINTSDLDIDEIYIDFTNKVIGYLDDKLFLRYYEDKDVQYEPYIPSVKMLNGDVAELNKTVDTLKKSVSDGKTKVANAITDKGVETATDATFDVMAENISKIETGGGELHGATLAVSTEESTLFGQTVT